MFESADIEYWKPDEHYYIDTADTEAYDYKVWNLRFLSDAKKIKMKSFDYKSLTSSTVVHSW
jgi:hypothetical protein